MDESRLYARMHANLREFCRLLGRASPGARTEELTGVTACVTATAPDRSLMNCVVYEGAPDLAAALPRLQSLYEESGVRAWTVWVPEHDRDTARLLADAGHNLDAAPTAMSLELGDFDGARPEHLDLDPEPTPAKLAELNDRAYQMATPAFASALESLPGVIIHVARVDGRPASCVGSYDHDGDCLITFVATLPEARGRGLAGGLMALALHEARSRGCETSSLQATKMGEPVYARMGYRNLGPIEMWEHRVSP
jgi:GNAT superfamily N-acetyltransferase